MSLITHSFLICFVGAIHLIILKVSSFAYETSFGVEGGGGVGREDVGMFHYLAAAIGCDSVTVTFGLCWMVFSQNHLHFPIDIHQLLWRRSNSGEKKTPAGFVSSEAPRQWCVHKSSHWIINAQLNPPGSPSRSSGRKQEAAGNHVTTHRCISSWNIPFHQFYTFKKNVRNN